MQTLKIHASVPPPSPPMKPRRVYLINFPAAHTSGLSYACRPIQVGGLLNIVAGHDIYPGGATTEVHVISAVGHQGAADAFAALLGCEVPLSRLEVTFEPGDIAVACKLRRRPPEGAVLTMEAMQEIGFDLVRLDVSRLLLPGSPVWIRYRRGELLALGFSEQILEAARSRGEIKIAPQPLEGDQINLWERLCILWREQFAEQLAPTREEHPTMIDLVEIAEALWLGLPHRAEIYSVE